MTIFHRFALLLTLLLCVVQSQAADINIDFSVIKQNTIPDSVWVNNTTKDTAIMLDGTATLALVATPSALEQVAAEQVAVQLYPNPASTQATLAYTTAQGGLHHITITDMAGRTASIYHAELSAGVHHFALPALAAGNYCVSVSNALGSTTTLFASNFNGNSSRAITHIATETANTTTDVVTTKTASLASTLPYDLGDQLEMVAYFLGVADTVSSVPQASQTVDFDIMLSLEDWEKANFESGIAFLVESGKDTLTIDKDGLAAFVENIDDVKIVDENGDAVSIQIVFENNPILTPEILNTLANSGKDLEIIGNTGYSIEGTVKWTLLDKVFRQTASDTKLYTEEKENVNNENFSKLFIDFSDDDGNLVDINNKTIKISSYSFGKVKANGYNIKGTIFCDYYVYDSNYAGEDYEFNIIALDKGFYTEGQYGVDWDIESMELMGGNIIEHADALQKLEENTTMTKADIIQAIADGKITVASCSSLQLITDGVDEDGYLLPYMEEAITMAQSQIKGAFINIDELEASHPRAGTYVKVHSSVIQFLADLEGDRTLSFRETMVYGDDLVFENGIVMEFEVGILDVNIDGGGSESRISLGGNVLTSNVTTIKDTYTSDDIYLAQGCNLTREGSTGFENTYTTENDDRLRDFEASSDMITSSIIGVAFSLTSDGIKNYIADYKNNVDYTAIQ